MFSEYLNGDYKVKRFIFKGTTDQIEKIKNDSRYYIEIIREEHSPFSEIAVIELSEYSDIEEIIDQNPELMSAGFVEDWDERHDVYVAFSSKGSSVIDNCVRVGFFDGHNDFNWHDKCPITAVNHEVKMGYSGEYDTVIYRFPFAEKWNS